MVHGMKQLNCSVLEVKALEENVKCNGKTQHINLAG